MDITVITEWLKNTIPGIILLGAIGSIVAASIIWLTNRFLLPLINKSFRGVLKKIVIHFLGPAAKELVRLHFVKGDNKVHVFYTLQVMKLSFSLFIATCGFVLFALSLFQEEQVLFHSSVLTPLIASFLAVWYALRCLAVALVPLYIDVEKLITESKDKIIKELEMKNS